MGHGLSLYDRAEASATAAGRVPPQNLTRYGYARVICPPQGPGGSPRADLNLKLFYNKMGC